MFDFEQEEEHFDIFNTKSVIEDDGTIVVYDELTGKEIKRIDPIRLPDKTIMDINIPFLVKATREHKLGDQLTLPKGSLLIAKRFIDGYVHLFTRSENPFLAVPDAKYQEDFEFITDLSKLDSNTLLNKLRRVLDIENYEEAVKIRDELHQRKVKISLS